MQIQISLLLQIWIYTVCKGRTCPGSAGPRLNYFDWNNISWLRSSSIEKRTSWSVIEVSIKELYYTPGIHSMPKGCIVFVRSFNPFVCPPLYPSVPFYNRFTWKFLDYLYNVTLQPLIKNFSYLVWGYLGGFFFHSSSMGHAPGRG